jgi:hypothetical protein
MLCDVRRNRKQSLNNNVRQHRSSSSSTTSSVGHNLSARRTSPSAVLHSREGSINENVLD